MILNTISHLSIPINKSQIWMLLQSNLVLSMVFITNLVLLVSIILRWMIMWMLLFKLSVEFLIWEIKSFSSITLSTKMSLIWKHLYPSVFQISLRKYGTQEISKVKFLLTNCSKLLFWKVKRNSQLTNKAIPLNYWVGY